MVDNFALRVMSVMGISMVFLFGYEFRYSNNECEMHVPFVIATFVVLQLAAITLILVSRCELLKV